MKVSEVVGGDELIHNFGVFWAVVVAHEGLTVNGGGLINVDGGLAEVEKRFGDEGGDAGGVMEVLSVEETMKVELSMLALWRRFELVKMGEVEKELTRVVDEDEDARKETTPIFNCNNSRSKLNTVLKKETHRLPHHNNKDEVNNNEDDQLVNRSRGTVGRRSCSGGCMDKEYLRDIVGYWQQMIIYFQLVLKGGLEKQACLTPTF
ncbi:hypothetical protein V8G54_031002 [Vigna mungo]|uniref:Uncharacterized protein n=1 Tax=Vigna mungo TaxID=3915 RepID=A0AAQ3MXJ8_VIGMU